MAIGAVPGFHPVLDLVDRSGITASTNACLVRSRSSGWMASSHPPGLLRLVGKADRVIPREGHARAEIGTRHPDRLACRRDQRAVPLLALPESVSPHRGPRYSREIGRHREGPARESRPEGRREPDGPNVPERDHHIDQEHEESDGIADPRSSRRRRPSVTQVHREQPPASRPLSLSARLLENQVEFFGRSGGPLMSHPCSAECTRR